MDRHRGGGGGDRYSNNPESSHHFRNSRGPPSRSSFDTPVDHHHHHHHQGRSPTSYRGGGFSAVSGFSGTGGGGGAPRVHRPFDSPPRQSPSGGGGFQPMSSGSNFEVPLTGQKRGFPFSGRGVSPDNFDGGSFAKLFVGSVPRTATEENIRPLFEEHGRVIEVALIKDKRTGQQQGALRG